MQHGEATSEETDPDRPLTDRGRDDVDRVARAVARLALPLDRILHSGKLRARQTAATVAARWTPRKGVEERAGLGPTDEPSEIRAAIEAADETVLLVGHLPHLDRLASLLVAGDPETGVVAFANGGLVRLAEEGGEWRVQWILVPELVRSGG